MTNTYFINKYGTELVLVRVGKYTYKIILNSKDGIVDIPQSYWANHFKLPLVDDVLEIKFVRFKPKYFKSVGIEIPIKEI